MGRNNLQNDRLTTKLAGKYDYWLHTQKIHGAHVILWAEGQRPDDQSLHEAACPSRLVLPGPGGEEGPGGLHPP